MQLTVINGKKIPKDACKGGKNFSITISRNCTVAAITIIKIRNDNISACNGTSNSQYIGQSIIAVRVTTKITEKHMPIAVLYVFDITINGHIPSMYTKAMLLVNMDARNIIKGFAEFIFTPFS
jgi:hypothetical protein